MLNLGSSKSLNILHIASWYPSQVQPHLGNFVQRHIESISTVHRSTVLYIVKLPSLSQKFRITETDNNGIREIICYYKNRGTFGSGYLRAYHHVMTKVLHEQMKSFDLVHVHVLYKGGLLALQCKKKYNLPFIVTEHWTGYHKNGGREIGTIQRRLSKRIAKSASRIVPVSEHLANSMKKFGLNSNYSIVPNVVNHDIFKHGSTKHPKFTFIHVSSLVDDHKNVSGILRAFNEIHNKIDANLEIVGDGDITPFVALANALDLPSDRVSIKGSQPLEKIAEMMAQAHCLVLFSNYENQPCVIPEAHGAGLPVIATDVGGIKEHLTQKHGVLIHKQDETALKDAMTTVFNSAETFDQDWLRDYSLKHFSIKAIAESYSKIYSEVV